MNAVPDTESVFRHDAKHAYNSAGLIPEAMSDTRPPKDPDKGWLLGTLGAAHVIGGVWLDGRVRSASGRPLPPNAAASTQTKNTE